MTQANKNFLTNILNLAINLIVGLIYTPYLVNHIGMAAYGVLPLAFLLNQYINILSLSLVNALSRFYSLEYREGNYDKASSYLSSAIVTCVLFSILILPFLLIGIYYVDTFLEIPQVLLYEAKILFILTAVSFLISIISNCLNITLFADNYLDYINYTKIFRNLGKLLLNIVLFGLFKENLIYIGWAYFATEVIVLLFSIYYYLIKKPQGIHIHYHLFERLALYAMLTMVVWVVTQRLADVFLYKVDTVFMNVYFGIRNTGIIGAVSEFGSYIISLTGILGTLIGPLLLISYSKKEYQEYSEITLKGGYIVSLLCAFFCGLLIGSSEVILKLWLGPEYEAYGMWLVIKLVVIPYTTFGAVFSNSYLYAQYNKIPAITSFVLAFINILVVYIYLELTKSIEGYLVICLLFILAQGFLMNIYFYNRIYKGNLQDVLNATMRFTLYLALTSVLTWFSIQCISVNTIPVLVIVYLIVGCFMLLILDVFFLFSKERQFLSDLIPLYGVVRNYIIKFLTINN